MNMHAVGRYFGSFMGRELVIGEDKALLNRVDIIPDGKDISLDLHFICRGLDVSILIMDFGEEFRLETNYPDGTQKFSYAPFSNLGIGIENALSVFIEAVDNEEVDSTIGLNLTWE